MMTMLRPKHVEGTFLSDKMLIFVNCTICFIKFWLIMRHDLEFWLIMRRDLEFWLIMGRDLEY